MTTDDYERVIGELENLIVETRATLVRFEETGMDEQMPADYQRLHDIYTKAVNDQRAYTLAMLDLPAPIPETFQQQGRGHE
ncbi:hypothetical protein [Halomonas chromatireducens]|uniref:Uncharacterized protein n=1 Tax=Halomonas chromatireducens TaxID=507626 RepID=A0A0X8HFT5_9GAMM|nr:hypothetical protein [Halomonas chromatireducens]AMD01843.1 hypothetical protein LOKO_02791 [Halomonas chromatireducens]